MSARTAEVDWERIRGAGGERSGVCEERWKMDGL